MECRSTERRQWIVNKYDVVPVAHIQLLVNQTKHSDAGAMIENDYYIFYATDKASGKRETIQCCMGEVKGYGEGNIGGLIHAYLKRKKYVYKQTITL